MLLGLFRFIMERHPFQYRFTMKHRPYSSCWTLNFIMVFHGLQGCNKAHKPLLQKRSQKMYSLICRVAHKRTSMMLWDTNVEAKKSEPVTGSQKLIYCFSKGWLDEKVPTFMPGTLSLSSKGTKVISGTILPT